MFKKFFKKEKKNEKKENILIAALLIHAAKIDENYTNDEKDLIKRALINLYSINSQEVDELLKVAETKEHESNQILEFTREIKNLPEKDKIKIVEALWSIIYSNEDADMYETNLMRRLAGLLYIDSKTMGDIKHRVKEESK